MNGEDGKNGKGRERLKTSRASVRRGLRSQLFAYGVVTKYRVQPGSGTLDFLKYFGARFSSTEKGSLAGSLLYRKPGRARGRSEGKTQVGLSLSFNVTQHILASHQITLASYTRLAQSAQAREAVTFGKELRHEKRPESAAPASRPLVVLQRGVRATRGAKEIQTVHERVAREVLSRVKLETLSERAVAMGPGTQPVMVVRRSQPVQPAVALTGHAQTLLSSQVKRALEAYDMKPAGARRADSITGVYVSPQPRARVMPKAIPQVTVLSNKAEQSDKTHAPARLERTFFTTIRREGRARLTPSEKRAAGALLGSNLSEFIARALSADASLNESTAAGTGVTLAQARMLTLRTGATRIGAALTRRASVERKLLSERHEEMERVLVALRRETRLELPPVERVFASSQQRPLAQASSVVKQVEEKEVIETIRREVTTQMKSYSAAANFTRADFTIITDHVYDALARRLLNERERLGLNS